MLTCWPDLPGGLTSLPGSWATGGRRSCWQEAAAGKRPAWSRTRRPSLRLCCGPVLASSRGASWASLGRPAVLWRPPKPWFRGRLSASLPYTTPGRGQAAAVVRSARVAQVPSTTLQPGWSWGHRSSGLSVWLWPPGRVRVQVDSLSVWSLHWQALLHHA